MSPRFHGLISLCALLTLASAAQGFDPTLPSLGLVINNGLCPDGARGGGIWPGGRRPQGVYTWGSFCSFGDEDLGSAESQEFLAPPTLDLYLAGYPGLPGNRLFLRNVQSGQETEFRPPSTGEHWNFNTLPVPPEWVGKPVQLIAEDRAPNYWFAFSMPFLPASSLLPAIDTTVPQGGFCPNGVYGATEWPGGVRPPGIVTLGSFCKSGDADTGWGASQPFVADSSIDIYLAGYPGKPQLRLAVEHLPSGRQLLLQTPAAPAEKWRLHHFILPDGWSGQSVRIIAQDRATGSGGWLAFSEPVSVEWKTGSLTTARRLGLLLLLAVILFLPSVAACLYAAFRGIQDLLDLTTIALLALGLAGFAAFWIYFCHPILGVLFSYGGVLACCAAIACLALPKNRRSKLRAARQLIAPGALVILSSIFIVSLGLLYNPAGNPISITSSRFGPPGPPVLYGDNTIPKLFADGVYSGHVPKPFPGGGGWRSSDRPPLQTGNVLWAYAWTSSQDNRDLPYELASVILQCSFLAALWGFLAACNIDRRPMAMAVATCFVSGFTFLNCFFVWPKLFPVTYLLIAAAYLLTGRYYQVRDRTAIGALLGAAVAFSMLGHGGSIFAIFGLAACMLLLRRYPSRRLLTGMAVGALVFYGPWLLYQKLYDPPGDRLLKLHLAGVNEPRPEVGLTGLILRQYGKLSSADLVEYKVGNFKTLAGDLPQYLADIRIFGAALVTGPGSRRNAAAGPIQRAMFLVWIPSIGFAVLGPFALLAGMFQHRRKAEFIAAARIWLLTGLMLAIWCLIMFGPGSTEPRQGTYLTEILALAGLPLAFWAIRPWLAVAITALQILWNAVLFIWLTPATPPPGLSWFRIAWGAEIGPANFYMGAACLLSGAAIFSILANFARQPASPDPQPVSANE